MDPKLAELGNFLAERRAEVTPQQVGLPRGAARRVPGLRREEVAMLAGIGASWYAWIEQGRAKNVSPEILGAIAQVLRLDEAQRLYAMRLAGYAPAGRPQACPDDDLPLLLQIVDGFLPSPAYVLNPYWDVTVANATATRLLGLTGERPNYLETLFLDPAAPERLPHWEQEAAAAVAAFRVQSGDLLADARLAGLVGALSERSALFASLWARHLVADSGGATQLVRHPELGELEFTRVSMCLSGRPGMQVILLSPQFGTAELTEQFAGLGARV
ncbi:helix-turn-helix transcriptional regulator [Streptomyces antimicrobicus]|uniref:Helix-turn-helix transcriptional regulator n=1 Tax=Streptomyces antimicrobicus TaxID=2883108 RepID=A0ABS8B8M1_9ACTN|nr:helix-turn-helix transcriptional regulator [Streptomyces antimicrobicus]MCB5180965.1 helix-turn-helix transcriptional regulator [Streptomyces antimicrobicus]